MAVPRDGGVAFCNGSKTKIGGYKGKVWDDGWWLGIDSRSRVLRFVGMKTSIFPDSKTNTYLLPLKVQVRKKENIHAGDTINSEIEILV